MSATHNHDSTPTASIKLYLGFDLGWTSWNLAFTTDMAQKPRLRTIPARDLDANQREIQRTEQRFDLPDAARQDDPEKSVAELDVSGFIEGGRGSSFEPDLNFVAIRIGDVSVGEAGSELAATKQAPSGVFDLGDGTIDVAGIHEPKTEMCDAPAETGGGGVLDKGDDVVPAGSLSMDESLSTPVLAQSEDLLVEPQRASQIADGEIDMRKAVGLNHCYFVSPPNDKAHLPRRTVRR